MKKKFLQFLIILAMSVQLLPDTFVRIIAEDTSIIHNEYVTVQTENAPDATLNDTTQLPEGVAILHMNIQLENQRKEEKYLVFQGNKQPGKLSVSALDGYKIESITIDDKVYENESILFDYEAGMLDKKVTIHVVKIENETSDIKQPTLDDAKKESISKKNDTKSMSYPYTPDGANYQIVSGNGTSTDPYFIDITVADIYLPGDAAITDTLNNNNSDQDDRFRYTFDEKYDYIYEAMLNMGGDGYTLLRTYGINGFENGKVYKVIDPMAGSSLVYVDKGSLASAIVTYDSVNTHKKDGLNNKWQLHYAHYTGAMKVNIHYVLDGKEHDEMTRAMKIKSGNNTVNDLNLLNEIKLNGTSYSYDKTSFSINGEGIKEFNVTNNKLDLYIHYSQRINVVFNPNGGYFKDNQSSQERSFEIGKGGKVLDTIPDATKKYGLLNYKFLGWYTDKNVKYEEGMTFLANTVFYAKYVEPFKLTLTVKNGDAVYDGKSHGLGEKVSENASGFEYSSDGGETWTKKAPSYSQVLYNDENKVTSYPVKVRAYFDYFLGKDYSNIVDANITISPRPLEIKAASEEFTYNGEPQKNSNYSYTLFDEKEQTGLLENQIIESVKVKGIVTNVGEKVDNVASDAIIKTKEGSLDTTKNYDITYVNGILSVKPASYDKNTVTVKPSTEVYDGEKHTVGEVETSVKDAEVYYSVDGKEWSKEKPTFTEKGDYTVYVQARDKNYHDSKVFEAKVSITARPITITADSEERDYNGIALTSNKYTVSKDGLVKGQEIGSVEVVGSITNVGTAENTAKNARIVSGKDDTTDNYKIKYVNGILKITPAEASKNAVTVVAGTATYDGEKHGLKKVSSLIEKGTTFYYATNADAKPEEWTTKAPEYVNAGTYPVFVKAVNPNYKTTDPVESSIVINKKEIQIKPKSATKVYGEEDPKLEASVEGLVKEDKATYTIVRETGEDVKEYTIEIQNAKASANYTIKTDTAIFKITSASADGNTVTVKPSTEVYDGEKHTVGEVETSVKDAEVYYSADGKEWSKEKPTFTEKGDYTVYVQARDKNYHDSKVFEAKVTITARPITITANSVERAYDGRALTSNKYTVSKDGLVKEQKIETVRVEGTITNVGQVANVVKDAKIVDGEVNTTNNYDIIYVNGILKITLAEASKNAVTVVAGTATYDGEKHGLKKVSSLIEKGTTLYYATNADAKPEEWTTKAPEYVNAGTYPVFVKAVNPNYKTTEPVESSIIINKKEIQIKPKSATKVYGEEDPKLEASVEGLVKEDKATYTIVRDTGEDVKEYTIEIQNAKASANYTIKTDTAIFKITPAEASKNAVTVVAGTATYDGEKHGLKKVSSLIEKGTTFYYATNADAKPEEWTTKAPEYVNAGTYPVFVKAVNPNYKTTDPVESSIVINKKEIQIKPKSATKVYGEEDPKLEASVEGLVKEDKATYSIVRDTGEDVKEYTIEIQNAKASANYTIKTDTAIFKITPAEASKNAVTVVAGTATYDGEKHGLKKVSSLIEKGTTFYYATKADAKPEEWTTNAPQYVNAGTYPVFVKAVNPNYKTADPVESSIVIDKKVVTIQPIETSKIFGEKDKELIAQVTGMVQGDTIAYEVKRDAGENAGKYTIHIKNVAISDNYTVDTKTSIFTIHTASADGNQIYVKDVEKVYDGKKHKAQEAKALEGSKIEYSIDGGTTWEETIPTRTNAGKTIVQVRATHQNFEESKATEEIVITKRIATIQANPAQKVYKESEPTLSAKLKNVVSGEEAQFEYTVERKTGENVGTYDITVTNVKELGNYEIETEGAKFTINKASSDKNKVVVEGTKTVYDGNNHGLTSVSSAVSDGTTLYYATSKDANDKEWTTVAPQYVNAGTYPVFVKAVNPNYETAEPVASSIVIDKKVVTIQPIETSKIFGEKDKELIAQVTGMVQGDTIAYEVKRDAGENAGKYTIHIENVAISDNYTVDTKTSTFTIHKASADGNRIFVKNVNKVYDGEKLKAQEAKALEGSKIEYSIDGGTTWKEAIPTRTNAGKTIVQVRATHQNFEESKATEEIVITKRIATIQANPAQKVYKESEPTLSAKLKNVVSGEEAQFEYTVERKTGENVGTYDITVTNVKELGNYEIKTEGAKFTINKASNDSNKVSVEDTKATYDGEDHTVGKVETTVDGAKVYYSLDGKEWSQEKPQFIEAGEYTVYVQAKDDNYEDSTVIKSKVTIAKRDVTITASSSKRAFNKEALTSKEYSVSKDGLVKGQEIGSIEVVGSITNVGTAKNVVKDARIVFGKEDTTNNYKIHYVEGLLEVVKASNDTNKVLVEDTKATYDGENHTVGKVETTVDGAKVYYSLDGKEWSQEKPQFIEAGEYTVYVQAKDDNYEDSAVIKSKVNIAKRDVTITASSSKRAYNKEALTSKEYSVSEDGLVKGQEIGSIEVVGSITNVGTAKNVVKDARIVFGKEDTTNNYKIHYVEGLLEVVKASNDTNKVSVEDTNATYDGEDHTVGKVETTVNDSEVLYSKDGKEWSKEIPSFTEAGTYEVYLKAVNENYQDSEVFTGYVVIAKRAITVTAQSASKVFDNVALVQPGYTLSENALVKEQTMEVEITGSQQAVGTSENKVSKVTVFAGVSDKTSNYEIQTISGTLRVTAAITPVTPIPQLPLTPPFIPGVVVVNPEVQVPNNTTPKTDGKEVVKKKETPKAADKGTWALLNLLLAGGTLVLAIFLLVSKRKKEDEEEEEGKDHIIYTRKTWLKLTSSVIAILSVIVFCVTEDITLKMVFVDTWTLWMVVFFVVQVGTFYFGRKWKEEAAKQEDYIVE